MRRVCAVGFVLVLPWLSSAWAADAELRAAARALISGSPTTAAAYATRALESEPKSRLAHWIRAQSFKVLSGAAVAIDAKEFDLLHEAQVRIDETPQDKLPANLVVMPRSAERGAPVLLVDAERSRLYVYASQNGKPVLLDEFYTSIGALGFEKEETGDRKTPIGVYRIRYEIRDPRSDGFLGNLAMTLDYPNAYDNFRGRTGSGIWIHGVPDYVHVRPPKASDGCLALANNDVNRLRRYVRYQQTQVVVVPRVTWLTEKEWEARAAEAVEDFTLTSRPDSAGVFFVSIQRPWVVSITQQRQFRREYWTRPPMGKPRLLLEENLS